MPSWPPRTRRPKPFTVYFVAQFDRPVAKFGGWTRRNLLLGPPVDRRRGKNAGGVRQLRHQRRQAAAAQGGASPTPAWQARARTSKPNCRTGISTAWCASRATTGTDWLGRIEVEGGTEAQRVKFYTDLWHALLGRRIVSDVGRPLLRHDRRPSPSSARCGWTRDGKPLFPHHNFDALWGSHWSLNILWSFAYPEVMDAFCNTMVDMYRQRRPDPARAVGRQLHLRDDRRPGRAVLRRGLQQGHPQLRRASRPTRACARTPCPAASATMPATSTAPNACGGGMKYYVERGYVPEGIEGKGVHKDGAAMTLEYAYQDWCLAQLALALGKDDDAEWLLRRSQNYTQPLGCRRCSACARGSRTARGCRISRRSGPKGVHGKGFCEANSAIYTHFVPHDMPGLIAPVRRAGEIRRGAQPAVRTGGPDRLRRASTASTAAPGWTTTTSPPPPWPTCSTWPARPGSARNGCARSRSRPSATSRPFGGYNGDEDQGQMGALGVLMAIGLFDVEGGAAVKPTYQITVPVFDRVTIHLNPRLFSRPRVHDHHAQQLPRERLHPVRPAQRPAVEPGIGSRTPTS